ncbi:MAG: glycosyltransferase family 39 protein [Ottowia sp.]
MQTSLSANQTRPMRSRRSAWAETPASTLWRMAAVCLAWALLTTWYSGNLDRYHDMLENYAWSWPLAWGTHKHPPLFSWVVGIWFSVMPQSDGAYRLLSYANVLVGLWGVRALGRRLGLHALADWGALLLLWSIPYTNMAGKFNANTQLLSLWPWAAALLLASWQERGARGALLSILLGLVAAACVLAKYFSGLLLAGFLVPTLLHPQGRAWLRTPRPYLALLVFGLALLPHLAWLAAHGWPTLEYAMEQGGKGRDWSHLLRFALAPLFYWLPAWLLTCLIWAARHARQTGATLAQTAPRFLVASWRPHGAGDVLFWLAFTPWALALGFGLAAVVELSTPWAIPIGYAFALLWLRNLDRLSPVATADVLMWFRKLWWPLLGVVLVLGAVLIAVRAESGNLRYYRPTRLAAEEILRAWHARHPGQTLQWVGGAWAENAMLSFYVQPRLRTLPGVPDGPQARVYGAAGHWQQNQGLLLCPRGPSAGATVTPCEQEARAWLRARGLPDTEHLLAVQRSGWRFPKPVSFTYAVFDVPPIDASKDRSASAPGPAPS